MMEIIKRYSVALFLLIFVSLLMLIGTMGVTMFGEKMFKDTGVDIKPRGERLTK